MTDIIVELSDEDQATLDRYATAENKPQEEWAKAVLSTTLQRLAKRDAAEEASVDMIDRAFTLLDSPNEPRLEAAPAAPTLHPCGSLDKEQLRHYAGQSEGTCRHRKQDGRPCFFGAGAARQCNLYTPRTVNI